jgi:demethylmenaquinone methyltransferase/2-methoxy-6-polyprenyl-1,4-benzoquinol methylase
MFDRISGVYDGMNLVISGFQEPRWRRQLIRASGIGPGARALDVACGTGKVTVDLYRAAQPGGSALGIDFSAGMIEVARGRSARDPSGLAFQQGDALDLPVEDDAFDAATIAFGMRNLADYRLGFAEMARAVRPGGRVACLEITRPSSRLGKLIAGWFDNIVPVIGRVVGQGDAYAYLVQSTREYPRPERIAEIMREAGLVDVAWRGMSGGIVVLHVGSVPEVTVAREA